MGDEDLDIDSSLIDLSEIDLMRLTTLRDSALTQALRRILQTADNPDEMTSAFQQSI
ncbi:MAG TPA: FxSxx-COOH cyclophane-containing RiPP peptide [Mycobacteriales bacterium]|nr:FxSxx-COOH cyclophane-containing RiPP peptide [Mycobacteriales bacterium]